MSRYILNMPTGKLLSLFLVGAVVLSSGSALAKDNHQQTQTPAVQKTSNNDANNIYQKNKLARCNIFSGDMKALCVQQIMDGPIQGSVSQGGTLYEPAVLDTFVIIPE